jgi:hypothetical protein
LICIKQGQALVGFYGQMTKSLCLVALVCLSSHTLADRNADAVNERIPVEKEAMEQHWRVDCSDAWERWRDLAAARSGGGRLPETTELQKEMKLCAFIYQPPGSSGDHTGPDYRGAADTLDRWRALAD